MGLFGLRTKSEVALQVRNAELQGRLSAIEESQLSLRHTYGTETGAIKAALEIIGFYGAQNDSGVSVTDKSVFGIPAYMKGINILSDGLAVMKPKRYEAVSDGKQEVYDAVLAKPNRWQTQFDWLKYMVACQVHYGNGLSIIVRNRYHEPVAYIPVCPVYVTPVIVKGQLYYNIKAEGYPTYVSSDDMIHFKGLCMGSSLVWGMGVIEYHAQNLGITLAAEKGHARANKTNGKKAIITGIPGKGLTEPQKVALKADFDAAYNGDALSVAIPNDVKVEFMQFSSAEMDYINTRDFGALEISRMLNIPASFLDVKDNGNKGSEEQDGNKLYANSLLPLATKNEQELAAKTITDPKQYYKFNFNQWARANIETRHEAYKNMLQSGWSMNEIRGLEDWNTVPGGDERFIPLNQLPLSMLKAYYDGKIESFTKSNNPNGENLNTES